MGIKQPSAVIISCAGLFLSRHGESIRVGAQKLDEGRAQHRGIWRIVCVRHSYAVVYHLNEVLGSVMFFEDSGALDDISEIILGERIMKFENSIAGRLSGVSVLCSIVCEGNAMEGEHPLLCPWGVGYCEAALKPGHLAFSFVPLLV